MAKQARKMSDFYDSRRRRCTLVKSELLKSKGNEKRMKLLVSMLMSGTDLAHCPEPFLTQFGVMEKQDSATNRAVVDVQFDSMAVRIFSTDGIVEPTVDIAGALLHRFSMVGEGVGEKRTVSLDFLIYLPATLNLRTWEWDHIHGEFFLEAVQSQGSLDLSDEADEEDEGSQTPLSTEAGRTGRVTVMPPAAKSGPKQLAEFHEKVGRGPGKQKK